MRSKRLVIGMALLAFLAGAIGWRAGLEYGRSRSDSTSSNRLVRAARPAKGVSAAPARILLPPPEKDILSYEPRDIDKLIEAMERTISVDYKDTPFISCIEDLSARYGLPFQIQSKDLEDAGVAIDSPVTLKMDGVRLESALQLMLQPLQLKWIFQHEGILISTIGTSGEFQVTAVYPVGDLAADADDFDELTLCIENGIAPDSWEVVGGPGSIDWLLRARCLSIRHTWEIHQEIRLYLRCLRDAAAIAETPGQLKASPNAVIETTAVEEARAKLARELIQENYRSRVLSR